MAESKEEKEVLLQSARQIIKRLRRAGHEAYLVGGSVRDLLLGRLPKDYDVATSAHPEEIQRIFRRTIPVGIQFGVMMVIWGGSPFEVATFRADGAYLDGRRPESVTFSSKEEDVQRRDFTINGLMYDPEAPEGEEVLDLVGGAQDLQARLVRAIGDPRERFEEDRLRMLRAVRFASVLGFTIEEKTHQTILSMAPRIEEVSVERILLELLKILMGPGPGRGLRLLQETGLRAVILSEMTDEQVEEAALRLDLLARRNTTWSEPLALAALLADLSPEGAERQLVAFRPSREQLEGTVELIAGQGEILNWPSFPLARQKRILRHRAIDDRLALGQLVCEAKGLALDPVEAAADALRSFSPSELAPPLLLNGNDLKRMGYRPGPLFKEMLTALEDAQLEGRLSQKEEAEAWLVAHYGAPSPEKR